MFFFRVRLLNQFHFFAQHVVQGVQSAVKDADARGKTYADSQELALAVEDVCAEALPIEEAVIMAGEMQIRDLRAQHDPARAGWNELQSSIEQRGPRFERVAREAAEAKQEENARRLKMGKGQLPDDADVEQELRKLRKVFEKQKSCVDLNAVGFFRLRSSRRNRRATRVPTGCASICATSRPSKTPWRRPSRPR